MLLKYFYDPALAHASYMVGCQKTGEAIIVDPGRDVQQYLDAARGEGMKIVGAADTHIHADYVSGARELAHHHGAKLYVSDEGPAEWKYDYAAQYDHQLLKDGDTFGVGKVEFKVIHTPGHTPESISFLLTDRGGGADRPMGLFTGDFVFVGSIGRPDLLEEAAGIVGTAEPGARELFHSAEKFKQLPDYLQIWPAHGAGSACGKGLGAIPSSTVGYEKMFNPALQFDDEQAFVNYILAEQPEAPKYFAVMKRVNKEGPEIIGDRSLPSKLPVDRLATAATTGQVVDTTPSRRYAQEHVPQTINIPEYFLASWAGWLVDYERPLYLITSSPKLPEAVRILNKIGIDQIAGYFDPAEAFEAGLCTESYEYVSPESLVPKMEAGDVILIDVRGDSEWKEHSIPQAKRCFLADLPETVENFTGPCTLAFACRGGGRSAIACSIAQAAGISNVVNMTGGVVGWIRAGLPAKTLTEELAGPGETGLVSELAHQSQAVFWNAECPKEMQQSDA
jgi:hydroxyacylglutathione hydrolase